MKKKIVRSFGRWLTGESLCTVQQIQQKLYLIACRYDQQRQRMKIVSIDHHMRSDGGHNIANIAQGSVKMLEHKNHVSGIEFQITHNIFHYVCSLNHVNGFKLREE